MVHQIEAHEAMELGNEGFVGRHLKKKLLAQKTGTPISLPLSIPSWSSRVHTPLPRDRGQAMATVGHTSVAGGSLP